MNGEERLECEVHIDVVCLEHVSEFRYLGCVLGEAGTEGAECSRKVASWRRVGGPQLLLRICRLSVLALHKTLLVPVLSMSVREWYGRRRHLGLGLYRWTTSGAWLVLGGWIKS